MIYRCQGRWHYNAPLHTIRVWIMFLNIYTLEVKQRKKWCIFLIWCSFIYWKKKKTLYKQQNSMCCLLGWCYSWTLSGLLNIEQKNLDSSGRLVDDQTEQLIKSGHHCTGHCRDSSHNEYELLSHWTLLHTLIATMFGFFSY